MEDLRCAIKSGLCGYKAMTIQVCSLMWLRTIMNYQYKNGTSIKETIKILYSQGGVRRFYKGILPGLIQGPISRFGDTFSNSLALNITKQTNLPIFIKTGLASITAGLVRVLISPIDTIKTIQQVEGDKGFPILKRKIKENGILVLYEGATANGIVTLIGHFPWFVMHNYLNRYVPTFDTQFKNIVRNAVIGFCSTLVSDTCSNCLRVIKTAKQTSEKEVGYLEIVQEIIKKDGVQGLFLRGLTVRIFTNGIQGLMFNVLWKYFDAKKGLPVKGMKINTNEDKV